MADNPLPESGSDDDPMRVVRLLWDPPVPAERGRKQSVTLDGIVAAGVRIADARGVDALSMRQLAAELGLGAMSLYTYIASKAELVELMVDRVFGEIRAPDAGDPPRERVAALATASWELYHRHPWILQTNLWRFSIGPHVLDRAETLYAALDAWGVDARDVYRTAATVDAFVQGAARSSVIDRQTEQLTGESFEGYFSARVGFWEEYFDVERYPVHTRVWNAGGFDLPEGTFEFGLERILDAIGPRAASAGVGTGDLDGSTGTPAPGPGE